MKHGAGLDRAALFERLRESRVWDVIVIGGGATGLGCAVDAAARGHSTLLLEAHDFAKGTSSRATKLIHGGVRYLAQGRLGLVREALFERACLLANAPHIVQPLRFIVPTRGVLGRLGLTAGLGFYDLLAGSRGIAPCRMLDRDEVAAALPALGCEGVRGGVAYWDAQFDDARLAIALMLTVHDLGGLALNHVEVSGLRVIDGRVAGVQARDEEGGESFALSARTVINATGVWADSVRRLDDADVQPLLRPSQGVHIVVDADLFPGRDALLIPATADGRVLFVLPWQGKVLIGTTDTERDDAPFEPRALAGEVEFLLQTAGQYLQRAPVMADVRSVFAGLRPLIGAARGQVSSRLSREHLVEVSATGLVTVTGGKWTTYRCMAEDAVNAAERAGRLTPRVCVTRELRLHGADEARIAGPAETAWILETPLCAGLDVTAARVRHAARHEMARTVEDVLARRHRALFLDAAAAMLAAPAVAQLLAAELGRDEAWCAEQVESFAVVARGYLSNPVCAET